VVRPHKINLAWTNIVDCIGFKHSNEKLLRRDIYIYSLSLQQVKL